MDQELRDYLDQQFKSVAERFEEVNERFDRVESGIRENRVLIEALDGKVQLVAEGVANVDSKLETFRGEVAKEFKEVRATMDLHFSHLDRRVKKLERPRGSRKQPARASSG
jgi:hypothetical protein